mmetsp:Transcript_20263/g.45051  ORF Transcript_20263/g.45051 Transcript_20263/m.45051 type:complete len:262 (+) Transcript_20263:436-1221(+)
MELHQDLPIVPRTIHQRVGDCRRSDALELGGDLQQLLCKGCSLYPDCRSPHCWVPHSRHKARQPVPDHPGNRKKRDARNDNNVCGEPRGRTTRFYECAARPCYQHGHGQDSSVRHIKDLGFPRLVVALSNQERRQQGNKHNQLLGCAVREGNGDQGHQQRAQHQDRPPVPAVHAEPPQQEAEAHHKSGIPSRSFGSDKISHQAQGSKTHPVDQCEHYAEGDQHAVVPLAAYYIRKSLDARLAVWMRVALKRQPSRQHDTHE